MDAEGDNKLRLSVGGYPFLDVSENILFASVIPQDPVIWRVNYAEAQDAYTIELSDERKGWSVSSDLDHAEVHIKPIIVLPTEPLQYTSGQLWRFVRHEE